MQRASEIRSAGTWNPTTAIDKVVLDADERYRRRIMLTGERGVQFLLDLPHAAALHDGDGLVLEDGALVRVAGKPESLFSAGRCWGRFEDGVQHRIGPVGGLLAELWG